MFTGTRGWTADFWRDERLDRVRSLSEVEKLGHFGLSIGRSHWCAQRAVVPLESAKLTIGRRLKFKTLKESQSRTQD